MKKFFIFSLLAAALLAAGCSDDDSPSVPIQIISGTENIEFEDTGRTFQNITFIAAASWTIEVENGTMPEWLKVNPLSGDAGKNTVNIRVLEKNITNADRSVTLLLQAGNSEPTAITVTQKFEPIIDPVAILPRKVKKVTVSDATSSIMEYPLTYNAQNRIATFMGYTITYPNNVIKLQSVDTDNETYNYTREYTLTMSDNHVTEGMGTVHIFEVNPEVDETTEYKYRYVYNERGFMSERIDSKPVEETLMLSWERGKLTSVGTPNKGRIVFTYGNNPNNLNLDMVSFLEITRGNSNDFARLLSFGGIRSQFLPVSMNVLINDSSVYQSTFEYTLDADGYVTKIVEVSAETIDITGNKTESKTYLYSFQYE